MTIEDKIKQFKAEVGNRTLTPEQLEVFRVFCRTSGKPRLLRKRKQDSL